MPLFVLNVRVLLTFTVVKFRLAIDREYVLLEVEQRVNAEPDVVKVFDCVPAELANATV